MAITSAAAISADTKPASTVANTQPTTTGNQSGEITDGKKRLSDAAIIGIAMGALGITVLIATAISIIYSINRNSYPRRCEICERACRRNASRSSSTMAEVDYTHNWYDSLSSLGPSPMRSHQKIPLDNNAEGGIISAANTSTASENISLWSSYSYVPQESSSIGNPLGSRHQQPTTPSCSQRGQERLHIRWRSLQHPEEPIYTRALNSEESIDPLKQATVPPLGSELESSISNVSRSGRAELPEQQLHFAAGTVVEVPLLNNLRPLIGPPSRCEGSAYAGQFADMDLSLTDEEDDEEFTESSAYHGRSEGTTF
ncbi:hypothetical protein Cpir12675_006595 [Ceratocystis pirilliformis]|uniref:Uncharacterized protein n=1 Tax=Ceratocystis pirilliformis TaxID=259994 RepID=A0ABR3YHG9_9PEZI